MQPRVEDSDVDHQTSGSQLTSESLDKTLKKKQQEKRKEKQICFSSLRVVSKNQYFK